MQTGKLFPGRRSLRNSFKTRGRNGIDRIDNWLVSMPEHDGSLR